MNIFNLYILEAINDIIIIIDIGILYNIFYLYLTLSQMRKSKLKLFPKTRPRNRRAESRDFRKLGIFVEKREKTPRHGLVRNKAEIY